jgi:putative ABC transport system substrate-binding protein
MRRREFLGFVGGAAAWPVGARAQQPVPVIAILGTGAADSPSSKTQMELPRAGMRELGLFDGKDYVFETRWADGDSSRFPALAAELLALHPAAVVASTNLAVTTVQGLSRTVPIVGASLNAPLAWKHLSSFPCRDVREAFDLSQRARQAKAHRFQNWGASR